MSLVKIPFIFADAVGMRITSKPPNSPLPVVDHVVPDWREQFLQSLAWPCVLLRAISWAVQTVEALVIILNHCPHYPIARLFLSSLTYTHPPQHVAIHITPLFLFGTFLTLIGSYIRLQCYRTLGRLFTFELSIQREHYLIVEGPYAVVRHPSYTGMILTIIGAACSQGAAGSWVAQSGLVQTYVGCMLVGYWLVVAGAVILSLLMRVNVEDAMLQRRFGDEWRQWRKRVRYALVPGLL